MVLTCGSPSFIPLAIDFSFGPATPLPMLSVVTMAMTVPQIWTIWADRSAAGVSLASWATYLLAACLWFVHGLQKRDKTIYLACIGWIVLDGAVVLGVLRYG